jgi:hypothetical protein
MASKPKQRDAGPRPAMDPKHKFNLWYLVAAVFGVILLQNLFVLSQQVETIPYSEFETYLREGRVGEITVSQNFIQGTLKPEAGRRWRGAALHYPSGRSGTRRGVQAIRGHFCR